MVRVSLRSNCSSRVPWSLLANAGAPVLRPAHLEEVSLSRRRLGAGPLYTLSSSPQCPFLHVVKLLEHRLHEELRPLERKPERAQRCRYNSGCAPGKPAAGCGHQQLPSVHPRQSIAADGSRGQRWAGTGQTLATWVTHVRNSPCASVKTRRTSQDYCKVK